MRASWGRIGVEQFLQDLRYASRQLRRSPGFAAIVIVTLALGIGATTAVFSVIHAVLLAPLPFEQPRQLIRLYQQEPNKPSTRHYLTGAHFSFLRDHATCFETVAATACSPSTSTCRPPATTPRSARLSRRSWRAGSA